VCLQRQLLLYPFYSSDTLQAEDQEETETIFATIKTIRDSEMAMITSVGIVVEDTTSTAPGRSGDGDEGEGEDVGGVETTNIEEGMDEVVEVGAVMMMTGTTNPILEIRTRPALRGSPHLKRLHSRTRPDSVRLWIDINQQPNETKPRRVHDGTHLENAVMAMPPIDSSVQTVEQPPRQLQSQQMNDAKIWLGHRVFRGWKEMERATSTEWLPTK
jgi:hypothetical protein